MNAPFNASQIQYNPAQSLDFSLPWAKPCKLSALLAILLFAIAPTWGTPSPIETLHCPNAMVVAGHPQAAEIGASILHEGGNAIDAAIATSLALGVAEPYGSGMGGKFMLLYYEAATQKITVIEALGESSQSLNTDLFRELPYRARSQGYPAVCVPGLPAGAYLSHQTWGRLPWPEIVKPSIRLAREGFLVLPKTAELFTAREKRIRVSEEMVRIYLPEDSVPEINSLLPNEDLAQTLESFRDQGAKGFYQGKVAEAIVEASQKGGGALTLEDFADYKAVVAEPITIEFRGFQIATGPAPISGGSILIATLAALAEEEWHYSPLRSEDNLHRLGKVLQQVYPEIQANIADVPDARERLERLLQPEFIEEIRRRAAAAIPSKPFPEEIDRSHSKPFPAQNTSGSTTHFVVVDEEGNAASVTQSLSSHFGAGVIAPGTGVILNNSMKNFASRNTGSVNFVAPGKRPRSAIAPALVLKDKQLALALGLPGGQRIPSAMIQVILDYAVFHRSIAEAISNTRFHLHRPKNATQMPNIFKFEPLENDALVEALETRDWVVQIAKGKETFGGVNAIEILPDGSLLGVADLRRTNAVRGF